eukprot:evm.model.scf_52.5 EVM.evm.TU.scf_52.5   scf_52:45111-52668(-)
MRPARKHGKAESEEKATPSRRVGVSTTRRAVGSAADKDAAPKVGSRSTRVAAAVSTPERPKKPAVKKASSSVPSYMRPTKTSLAHKGRKEKEAEEEMLAADTAAASPSMGAEPAANKKLSTRPTTPSKDYEDSKPDREDQLLAAPSEVTPGGPAAANLEESHLSMESTTGDSHRADARPKKEGKAASSDVKQTGGAKAKPVRLALSPTKDLKTEKKKLTRPVGKIAMGSKASAERSIHAKREALSPKSPPRRESPSAKPSSSLEDGKKARAAAKKTPSTPQKKIVKDGTPAATVGTAAQNLPKESDCSEDKVQEPSILQEMEGATSGTKSLALPGQPVAKTPEVVEDKPCEEPPQEQTSVVDLKSEGSFSQPADKDVEAAKKEGNEPKSLVKPGRPGADGVAAAGDLGTSGVPGSKGSEDIPVEARLNSANLSQKEESRVADDAGRKEDAGLEAAEDQPVGKDVLSTKEPAVPPMGLAAEPQPIRGQTAGDDFDLQGSVQSSALEAHPMRVVPEVSDVQVPYQKSSLKDSLDAERKEAAMAAARSAAVPTFVASNMTEGKQPTGQVEDMPAQGCKEAGPVLGSEAVVELNEAKETVVSSELLGVATPPQTCETQVPSETEQVPLQQAAAKEISSKLPATGDLAESLDAKEPVSKEEGGPADPSQSEGVCLGDERADCAKPSADEISGSTGEAEKALVSEEVAAPAAKDEPTEVVSMPRAVTDACNTDKPPEAVTVEDDGAECTKQSAGGVSGSACEAKESLIEAEPAVSAEGGEFAKVVLTPEPPTEACDASQPAEVVPTKDEAAGQAADVAPVKDEGADCSRASADGISSSTFEAKESLTKAEIEVTPEVTAEEGESTMVLPTSGPLAEACDANKPPNVAPMKDEPAGQAADVAPVKDEGADRSKASAVGTSASTFEAKESLTLAKLEVSTEVGESAKVVSTPEPLTEACNASQSPEVVPTKDEGVQGSKAGADELSGCAIEVEKSSNESKAAVSAQDGKSAEVVSVPELPTEVCDTSHPSEVPVEVPVEDKETDGRKVLGDEISGSTSEAEKPQPAAEAVASVGLEESVTAVSAPEPPAKACDANKPREEAPVKDEELDRSKPPADAISGSIIKADKSPIEADIVVSSEGGEPAKVVPGPVSLGEACDPHQHHEEVRATEGAESSKNKAELEKEPDNSHDAEAHKGAEEKQPPPDADVLQPVDGCDFSSEDTTSAKHATAEGGKVAHSEPVAEKALLKVGEAVVDVEPPAVHVPIVDCVATEAAPTEVPPKSVANFESTGITPAAEEMCKDNKPEEVVASASAVVLKEEYGTPGDAAIAPPEAHAKDFQPEAAVGDLDCSAAEDKSDAKIEHQLELPIDSSEVGQAAAKAEDPTLKHAGGAECDKMPVPLAAEPTFSGSTGGLPADTNDAEYKVEGAAFSISNQATDIAQFTAEAGGPMDRGGNETAIVDEQSNVVASAVTHVPDEDCGKAQDSAANVADEGNCGSKLADAAMLIETDGAEKGADVAHQATPNADSVAADGCKALDGATQDSNAETGKSKDTPVEFVSREAVEARCVHEASAVLVPTETCEAGAGQEQLSSTVEGAEHNEAKGDDAPSIVDKPAESREAKQDVPQGAQGLCEGNGGAMTDEQLQAVVATNGTALKEGEENVEGTPVAGAPAANSDVQDVPDEKVPVVQETVEVCEMALVDSLPEAAGVAKSSEETDPLPVDVTATAGLEAVACIESPITEEQGSSAITADDQEEAKNEDANGRQPAEVPSVLGNEASAGDLEEECKEDVVSEKCDKGMDTVSPATKADAAKATEQGAIEGDRQLDDADQLIVTPADGQTYALQEPESLVEQSASLDTKEGSAAEDTLTVAEQSTLRQTVPSFVVPGVAPGGRPIDVSARSELSDEPWSMCVETGSRLSMGLGSDLGDDVLGTEWAAGRAAASIAVNVQNESSGAEGIVKQIVEDIFARVAGQECRMGTFVNEEVGKVDAVADAAPAIEGGESAVMADSEKAAEAIVKDVSDKIAAALQDQGWS